MVSKILELHFSNKVPVFVKAKEIIDHENIYSVEEIVKTIDELTEYEKEIRKIKQQIIDATYNDFLSTIIMPLNIYYEKEYE